MKTICYLLLLCSILVLFSCEEEKAPPDPVTFLTIELKETFMENATDKWIFATNEKGVALDVVQLEAGTPVVTLQTTTTFSKIDLTIFSYYDLPTNNHFVLETFKGFPTDGTIVLGTTPVTPAAPTGNANITVSNYTETIDPRLNLKFSTKSFGTNGIAHPVVSGSNYSVNVALGAARDAVHAYGFRSGIPVYTTLTEVVPGESRTVDFLTFQAFENVVQLPLLGYAYTVGIEDDHSEWELVVSSKQASADPGQIYTATVPGFSKYLTFIFSFSGFQYWRIGTPLTSFTPPAYTTSIINNSIQSFKATITGDHDYKFAEFREETGEETTTWRINADNTTSLNISFDFPNELKTAYPTLSLDVLQYTSLSFYRSAGTFTYDDMIAHRFKNVLKNEFELYTLTSN